MIPAPEECYDLMSQYGMLDNIRAHSLVVARVAEFLGRELIKCGLELNIALVVSGALLHDIGKTACLNNGRNHAMLGADICNNHGFSEVAPLVAQHVILADDLPDEPDARQIVYYADKRVNHDRVVSIEVRLAYIVERYGLDDSHRCTAIRRNFNRCYEIEKTIFSYLGERPEYLLRSLPRQSAFEIKAA